MSHRLEVTQSMRHNLRLEINAQLRRLREGAGSSGTSIMLEALQDAVEGLANPVPFRAFVDESLAKTLAEKPEALIAGTQEGMRAYAADHLFSLHSNDRSRATFTYQNEQGITTSDEVVRADFLDALLRHDEMRRSIVALEKQIETTSFEGALQRRRELQAACTAAEALAEAIQQEQMVLGLLATVTPPGGTTPCLTAAAQRIAILEAFSPVITDRFVARFLARFKHPVARTPRARRQLEQAFLNTVAEYVLIACGILSPGIFRLHRWKMPRPQHASLEEALGKAGMTLDEALSGSSNALFCNRWATTGRIPSAETDGLVLGFITREVRKASAAIFDTFSFGAFLEDLSCADDDYGSATYGRENVLFDLLSSEYFERELMRLCSTVWYPGLRALTDKK